MKYLCLIYDQESLLQSMPESELGPFLGEYGQLTQELIATGKMLGGEELSPVASATTVRVRNGVLTTTDGPFAETKEQLGGFYLIDATDLNDAIRIAGKIPSARIGSIEVRPIKVRG